VIARAFHLQPKDVQGVVAGLLVDSAAASSLPKLVVKFQEGLATEFQVPEVKQAEFFKGLLVKRTVEQLIAYVQEWVDSHETGRVTYIAGVDVEPIAATPEGETFRTRVRLADGTVGPWFGLPAGTSTGEHEAHTVGVTKATRYIQEIILSSMDVPDDDLIAIHDRVIEPLNLSVALAAGRLSERYGGLGGDAVLSFEAALAYAIAKSRGVELSDLLRQLFPEAARKTDEVMTRPLMVVWSG